MDDKNLKPFKLFALKNFPFIEADFDAITNYELLCKIVEYLNNVIASQNETMENVQNLSNAFNQLYNYVHNYFDNLDVQEEINNKLDEMVEQGILQEIIADYLNSKAIFGFDNVNSMKESTNLIDGSYAKTLGYYEKNDGGSALYKVREITNSDVVDNMTIIPLSDENLIAEIIVEKELLVEQLGAKCNGVDDDSTYLTTAFNYAKAKNINVKSIKNITIKSEIEVDLDSKKFDVDLHITPILSGTALTFTKGIENNINIFVENGESTNAIAITEMFHSNIDIKGYYHNGCLLRVYGNDTNYTHNLGVKISLRNFNCKQTLNHADPIPSSGFGEYTFVWEETYDIDNAVGSIISNSYDVTINHWESHFVTEVADQINLTLEACKSCKINYLALGGVCSQLLKISVGSEIYADTIHLGSEDGSNVNGLLIRGTSTLYLNNLKLVSVGDGIDINDLDSNIDIKNIVPNNTVQTLIKRNNYNFGYSNTNRSFSTFNNKYPLSRIEVRNIAPTITFSGGEATYDLDIATYEWDSLLGINVVPYGTGRGFTVGIVSVNGTTYTLKFNCVSDNTYAGSIQLKTILFGNKALN